MAEIPSAIRRCGKIVKQLEGLSRPTHAEKELLNFSRLKMAVWACEEEGMRPSKENLSGILGVHAEDALSCYRKLVDEGSIRPGASRVIRKNPATSADAVKAPS